MNNKRWRCRILLEAGPFIALASSWRTPPFCRLTCRLEAVRGALLGLREMPELLVLPRVHYCPRTIQSGGAGFVPEAAGALTRYVLRA